MENHRGVQLATALDVSRGRRQAGILRRNGGFQAEKALRSVLVKINTRVPGCYQRKWGILLAVVDARLSREKRRKKSEANIAS